MCHTGQLLIENETKIMTGALTLFMVLETNTCGISRAKRKLKGKQKLLVYYARNRTYCTSALAVARTKIKELCVLKNQLPIELGLENAVST